MNETLKEKMYGKGHLIVKFIINQFAMSLFGIMVASPFVSKGGKLLFAAGIFTMLFFWFLIGYFINEDGLKDSIKVRGGRMTETWWLGLFYSFLGHLLSLIIAGANFVLSMIPSLPVWASDIRFVLNAITRIAFYGMFTGIDASCKAQNAAFLSASEVGLTFLLYTIPTLIVCAISYYLGLKGIGGKKKKEK